MKNLKESNDAHLGKILKADLSIVEKDDFPREQIPVSQIYLSDNNYPPGDITNSYIDSIKDSFAKCKYTLYNNEMIERLIEKYFNSVILKTYKSLKPYACKSDLARLCILYLYGGWYVDVSLKWQYKNPEYLTNNKIELIVFRDIPKSSRTSWACANALIFSNPFHPVLEEAINKIVKNYQNKYYGLNALFCTGPVVLGSALATIGINEKVIIGDFIESTPNYKIKNFLFLLPSGKILAEWKSHTNGGRLNETPGNKGTHDYNKFWDSRNIYGEKDLIK